MWLNLHSWWWFFFLQNGLGISLWAVVVNNFHCFQLHSSKHTLFNLFYMKFLWFFFSFDMHTHTHHTRNPFRIPSCHYTKHRFQHSMPWKSPFILIIRRIIGEISVEIHCAAHLQSECMEIFHFYYGFFRKIRRKKYLPSL